MASTFASKAGATREEEYVKAVVMKVCEKGVYGEESSYIQAVQELAESLAPLFDANPRYFYIFKSMLEPERMIQFRVPWVDDSGRARSNRGWRVGHSSALGPYKGGLRFHPAVDAGVIKFLAFEQTFKNALTGMGLGSGKGGSDFDPSGKSEAELRRFYRSFLSQLAPHMRRNRDVQPGACDVDLGGSELARLLGEQCTRLKHEGYGCVYFAHAALEAAGRSIAGARCVLSGSGSLAQHTARKLIALGAVPLTFSDAEGTVYEPCGFTEERLEAFVEASAAEGARLSEYARVSPTAVHLPGERPWSIAADAQLAFPGAAQAELGASDAEALLTHGLEAVFEGPNMPCTPDAVAVFEENGASNAGGVAASGLEMGLALGNGRRRDPLDAHDVDAELQRIMANIHAQCREAAADYGWGASLRAGANIAGFKRVADALWEQGAI